MGGEFTAINGLGVNRIARLDFSGAVDRQFNAGAGANGTVYALAPGTSGGLFVGGDFTQINGGNRSRIARLGTNGLVDLSFNPGGGADGTVYALAVDQLSLAEEFVILGGTFKSVNGALWNGIARLRASGLPDPNFNPGSGANGAVYAVDVQADGQVLLGGDFSSISSRGVLLPAL